MNFHGRKLQVPSNDVPFQPINIPSTLSPPPPPVLQQDDQYTNPPPPFDESMALTIFVLLTALLFMAFFSIYIRKFSTNLDFSYQHHRRGLPAAQDRSSRATAGRKGLDPEVVKLLPVHCYYRGEAKYQIDCAICLGEFEDKETVKVIPYCKHVFHLECIDTWLGLHVSCPVCRGTQFLEDKR